MENQAFLFIVFIINGFLIGVLFDIFRILRKTFKTTDFITYIEDSIFWIFSGLLTLYFIFCFNNGEIRLYIFLGIILGITIYMILISKYIIKVSVIIINFIKKIMGKILSIIIYPIKIIKKILLRPISFVFINIRLFFTKQISKLTKNINKIYKISKKEKV